MEFELKTGPQGHVYLPKKVRQILGNPMKLLPDAYAAVIYPKNVSRETVIASLQIIISDLQLRSKNKQRLCKQPTYTDRQTLASITSNFKNQQGGIGSG